MIRKANLEDASAIAQLACRLWPDNEPEEMEAEFAALLTKPDAAVFLEEDQTAVGFAQCQLRRDYVEGTGSSPVGYLEGVFVRPEYRRRGMARALVNACQEWAHTMGCTEFASDCELDNSESIRFHLALGFLEANRIICFTKKIGE